MLYTHACLAKGARRVAVRGAVAGVAGRSSRPRRLGAATQPAIPRCPWTPSWPPPPARPRRAWSTPSSGRASPSTRRIARLQRGRAYGAAKTGVVRLRNRTSDGVEHHYVLNVPDTYDPARRYQVRFHLHGGVGGRATNAPVGTGTIGALAGAEQIYVIPYAWHDAPWWSDDQVAEPRRDPRHDQAALQRRRKPRRRLGRVGRRHRRVLGGDARDDAVCELPAAQRLLDGAGAAATSTTACCSPTTCATSRSSRSTAGGSAVSDAPRRSAHRALEARRRRARLSAAAGGRTQHRVVAGGEGRVRSVRPRASAPVRCRTC